jgi:hypothetical protein
MRKGGIKIEWEEGKKRDRKEGKKNLV